MVLNFSSLALRRRDVLSVLILNLIFTYVYKMIFLFVFLVFNSSCAVSCKCSWLLGKIYIVCLFRIAIFNVEFVCFCLYSNYNTLLEIMEN